MSENPRKSIFLQLQEAKCYDSISINKYITKNYKIQRDEVFKQLLLDILERLMIEVKKENEPVKYDD